MAGEASAAEVAKEMAFEAVKGNLNQKYEYKIEATDKDDGWEVLILPKGRVRGGGARVHVRKMPVEVTSIVYLQ